MKIAICDDESAELSRIASLLDEYKLSKNVDFTITAFQSPVELISRIQNKSRFDIILLDIVMPVLNGMNAAREIREHDKTVKIIFLTSSAEFAVESYSVNAHYYVLKPILKENIFPLLDGLFLNILEQDTECLIVKCKKHLTRIPHHTLEYCEVINKTINYHISDGTVIESNGSMADLESALIKHVRFIKPHRSFIVNFDYIRSMNMKGIILRSGISIPIPRGKYNDIKQAFLDYSFTASAGEES